MDVKEAVGLPLEQVAIRTAPCRMPSKLAGMPSKLAGTLRRGVDIRTTLGAWEQTLAE